MRLGLAVLFMAASPAMAQELVYDGQITVRCLAGAEMPESRRACVGLAADSCMNNTPGGSSTVGMGGCLSKELDWWDVRLNEVYGQLMAKSRANDEEMASMGSHLPTQAPALRDMQRAWITFRDNKCAYEATLWQGGTGAGPAYAGCLMNTTAEQVFFLEEAVAW
ncbi:lysozyme inhibitor LprI family protein [Alisedimentitalea sp. MJ-SS2]|uniref:lysozyme inhibitor LprI family protein n=1 Tax=Aliisedimentitalea sp. MJ-SS2 TaxID=3049795 RepID=UPI002912A43C|nr:lysozyme inhibitor LprI family protein [Alisedimentitalea sp. MJ-SS2]MDU8929016.1 lysozyme inhibitor LprI family protein [Alisedimentitalea sp. MJ-SS2]